MVFEYTIFSVGGTTITPTKTLLTSTLGGAPIQVESGLGGKPVKNVSLQIRTFPSYPWLEKEAHEMLTNLLQVFGIPGYGHWANTTDPDVGPEHDVILGWNEPNQADQANIPPDVAALAWIEHQEKYADKVF